MEMTYWYIFVRVENVENTKEKKGGMKHKKLM